MDFCVNTRQWHLHAYLSTYLSHSFLASLGHGRAIVFARMTIAAEDARPQSSKVEMDVTEAHESV